ncbi:MAG: M23 family metallopeptidase [Sphingomicrobium sp.]
MRIAFVVAALLLGGVAVPVTAQSLLKDEILSSITVRPLAAPHPVLGADDRVHLAYELAVTNASAMFVNVDKVEAVDADGRVLRTIEGAHLKAMTMQHAGQPSTLAAGGSGIIFMDVSFAKGAALPGAIAARITATRQAIGPDGKPAPMPAGQMVPATYTFTTAAIPVGKPARVIDPPLRGTNWVAANGCCDRITPHRGALITVNGLMQAPERFAIDWVRIDAQKRASEGDYKKLASWPYYGDSIHSVADGTVVNAYDEAPEQVPGPKPTGITMDNIGGNMMVVDIGDGAFAFYAHLQRGSLKAKLGDKVKAGQVLGLLGNTGNSTAPHLHFHLMDGVSPLNANGLPYVFREFTGRGFVPVGDEDNLDDGRAVRVDNRLSGRHLNQLPMDNQVVDFGPAPKP